MARQTPGGEEAYGERKKTAFLLLVWQVQTREAVRLPPWMRSSQGHDVPNL